MEPFRVQGGNNRRDEQSIKKILHWREGETLLSAVRRFSAKHKKTVALLHQARGKWKRRAWHREWTIRKIAALLGISYNTVAQDVKRELLHPIRKLNINGRECLVFTRHEVRKYRDFKKEQRDRPKRHAAA